jgi:hypothetical protein
LGGQADALIGMRLKGRRTVYTLALSYLYTLGAMAYGQRESAAKRAARKAGVSWRIARRDFQKQNSIR